MVECVCVCVSASAIILRANNIFTGYFAFSLSHSLFALLIVLYWNWKLRAKKWFAGKKREPHSLTITNWIARVFMAKKIRREIVKFGRRTKSGLKFTVAIFSRTDTEMEKLRTQCEQTGDSKRKKTQRSSSVINSSSSSCCCFPYSLRQRLLFANICDLLSYSQTNIRKFGGNKREPARETERKRDKKESRNADICTQVPN